MSTKPIKRKEPPAGSAQQPAAMIRLLSVPANTGHALAYQIKEALGLGATPMVHRLPNAPKNAVCLLGPSLSPSDREKLIQAESVTLFGVRVAMHPISLDGTSPPASTVGSTGVDMAPAKRIRLAMLGMQAGDAIAAPLHWYYSIDIMKQHLKEFWGCDQLREYSAVPPALRGKHPDSWNYMKSFDPVAWVTQNPSPCASRAICLALCADFSRLTWRLAALI